MHPRRSLHRDRTDRLRAGHRQPRSASRASGRCCAGKFVIASIRLDDASINLTKTGRGCRAGPLEFRFVREPLGDEHARRRSTCATAASISNSATTKSVFYLTDTDLDIAPPASRGRGGACTVRPSPRAPTAPRKVSAPSRCSGRWFLAPERVDMDLQLDRTRPRRNHRADARTDGQHPRHGLLAAAPRRAHPQYRNPGPAQYRRRAPLGPAAAARARAGRIDVQRTAGPHDAATGTAVQLGGECHAAAVGALSRHRLPVAAALGRGGELESLSGRAADGSGDPHGRASFRRS